MTVNQTFTGFCRMLKSTKNAHSHLKKRQVIASYLKVIEDERTVGTVVQYLTEGAFSNRSGRKISIGSRTISLAASEFCEIDYELVFKPCRQVCTSLSETISTLFNNIPTAPIARDGMRVSLSDVDHYLTSLEGARTANEKKELLQNIWKNLSPEEVYVFMQLLLDKPILDQAHEICIQAVADAYSLQVDKIRHACMKTGSIATTTLIAQAKNIEKASLQLFQPIEFQNNTLTSLYEIKELSDFFIEHELPGISCQVHHKAGRTEIYTASKDEVSGYFPEVIQNFTESGLPDMVISGTICLCRDNQVLSDHYISKRISCKKTTVKPENDHPAVFMANDLLYLNGNSLLERPLIERKYTLQELGKEFHLKINEHYEIADLSSLSLKFHEALKTGYKSIFLKKKSAIYSLDPNICFQIMKPASRIHVVLLYAHRIGEKFNEFTLGISVKQDDRYSEDFIPIGKVNNDLKTESTALGQRIRDATYERYGPTHALKPAIIVEVEYDQVKENKRTKASFMLDNARICKILPEINENMILTLEEIETIFKRTTIDHSIQLSMND